MFYFFTRMALARIPIKGAFATRTKEQYHQMAKIWLEQSSKFYENQTIVKPFKVVLQYHPDNQDILDSYRWPEYTTFTTETANRWLLDNCPRGSSFFGTRIDYDDSFSVDLFEYLDSLKLTTDTIIMYDLIRQYHVPSKTLTSPMKHYSSMFITKYIHNFQPPVCPLPEDPYFNQSEGSKSPIYEITGNHTKVYRRPHINPSICYALQRVVGFNVINSIDISARRGLLDNPRGVPFLPTDPDPRFVGY